MNQNEISGGQDAVHDGLYVSDLIKAFWMYRSLTFVCFLIGVVSFFCWAYMAPNQYQATTVLVPSDESAGGGLGAIASQFSGVAALTGLGLNGLGESRTIFAMEVMKSRKFVKDFVAKKDIAPFLMAADSWDADRGEVLFDDSKYDINTREWNWDGASRGTAKPKDSEIYDVFIDAVELVNDKKSGLVTVKLNYISPVLAKEWLVDYVNEINLYMKERDVRDANANIAFLEDQLSRTGLASGRNVLFQLLEEQEKKKMLANVRTEYMFSVVDPAVVPEEAYGPKRLVLTFFGGVLGLFVGFSIALVRYSFRFFRL